MKDQKPGAEYRLWIICEIKGNMSKQKKQDMKAWGIGRWYWKY